MKYAGLWRAGKLIGDDEDDVRDTLLGEVERLQPENAELRQELETWWETAHDEGRGVVSPIDRMGAALTTAAC